MSLLKNKINEIKAREILDSRGNPTVEAELRTDKGLFKASVPSGASKGKYEAKELRDGEERYNGMGVLRAVQNVQEIIGPELKGKDPSKQEEIDNLMIEMDGTEDKSKLGANAILAVSIAVCRAGAAAKGLALYKYISKLSGFKLALPVPCFNIINGGVHAGNDLAIQEFMAVPQENSFSKNLQTGTEIYRILGDFLAEVFGKKVNIGDEGGYAPPFSLVNEALIPISEIVKRDYPKTKIALDCAASQFFEQGKYYLDRTVFTREGLTKFYQDLIENYPIIFIEDPFFEEDFDSFKELLKKLGTKITVVGDDLLATNIQRIKKAKKEKACNGLILKPNQIGTVSESLEAAKLAKSFGWKVIVSHRSGETKDDFIADLAVGIKADFIKSGAPARGERIAKYNRLSKIEEEL